MLLTPFPNDLARPTARLTAAVRNATVLSGIYVRAVVTHDVPPGAILAGAHTRCLRQLPKPAAAP